MTSQLNFAEIQGFILSSYEPWPEATYLFFQVTDPNKGQAWLKKLVEKVSFGDPWQDKSEEQLKHRVNIAFTYDGLIQLGVDKGYCDTFSVEFQEGVFSTPTSPTPSRSYYLGDVDDSDPKYWQLGGPNNPPVHIMLLLFAKETTELDKIKQEWLDLAQQIGGLTLLQEDKTSQRVDGAEHFGFKDGISQPFIKGNHSKKKNGQDEIAAGEFVLGYLNEYGLIGSYPADPLGRNGSYLVYRKLQQNVKELGDYLLKNSDGDKDKADWLGAKMLGRWKSGAPLALTPDKNAPNFADDEHNNAFNFHDDDPYGYKTPIGAHIRRANPRDGLETDPEESIKTVRRHRIIRRGRIYGPYYDSDAPDADAERGLLFIALNADIKRQFEFVQETWINDPKFNGLDTDDDTIVGENDTTSTFTIQRWPVRRQITSISRFIKVCAASYLFLPSQSALKFIAKSPISGESSAD